jgi:hypothetical protein
MKYSDNCYFVVLLFCVVSFSTTSAPLTAECVAEMYKMSGCPYSGLDSVGKCSTLFFISSKAFCCSTPQSTFPEPLSIAKNGRLHSASFDINQFNDGIRPVSFWTFFLLYKGCISISALILSGLASVPFVETK